MDNIEIVSARELEKEFHSKSEQIHTFYKKAAKDAKFSVPIVDRETAVAHAPRLETMSAVAQELTRRGCHRLVAYLWTEHDYKTAQALAELSEAVRSAHVAQMRDDIVWLVDEALGRPSPNDSYAG